MRSPAGWLVGFGCVGEWVGGLADGWRWLVGCISFGGLAEIGERRWVVGWVSAWVGVDGGWVGEWMG